MSKLRASGQTVTAEVATSGCNTSDAICGIRRYRAFRMSVRIRGLLLAGAVVAIVAAVAPGAALAAAPWATVNICDTKKSPDRIGIRGSMKGDLTKGGMWMRFRVQYFNRAKDVWSSMRTGGDSGFLRAGSSLRQASIQAGRTFGYEAPADGAPPLRLRGLVTFQWRTPGGRIKRTRERFTEGGHRDAVGADPKRYSAAECKIR